MQICQLFWWKSDMIVLLLFEKEFDYEKTVFKTSGGNRGIQTPPE